jgi:hypothetical protein
MSGGNGIYKCAALEEWPETKLKVDAMHEDISEMKLYLPHLEKLEALSDIKSHLMSAATGKNHIETQTAILIFKILGGVIFALLIVVVFLLTGEHFGVLGGLHR